MNCPEDGMLLVSIISFHDDKSLRIRKVIDKDVMRSLLLMRTRYLEINIETGLPGIKLPPDVKEMSFPVLFITTPRKWEGSIINDTNLGVVNLHDECYSSSGIYTKVNAKRILRWCFDAVWALDRDRGVKPEERCWGKRSDSRSFQEKQRLAYKISGATGPNMPSGWTGAPSYSPYLLGYQQTHDMKSVEGPKGSNGY